MLNRRSNPRSRGAMMSESIRRHHQISQGQCGQPPVDEVSPLNDSAGYRSGILMFSRRKKLLHADRRALELIAHPNQLPCDPDCGIHVGPACKLLNAVQAALDHRRAASIWEPFELKHILFEQRRKLVMRGLGLIDRESHDDSRIMILLEEVPLRHEHCESQEQTIRLFPETNGAGILRSAYLGSAHGVFDRDSDRAP